MNLTWKQIPHDPNYQVSTDGQVRNTTTGRTLKPYKGDKAGHLRVDLPNGRHYVHRLVAEVFIGPCPQGMECCHNDNNPENNHVENLRWDTRSNNILDLRDDRTRCRHGHPWEPWNIYKSPQGWQSCRTCKNNARKRYNQRKKGTPSNA